MFVNWIEPNPMLLGQPMHESKIDPRQLPAHPALQLEGGIDPLARWGMAVQRIGR
ncbi:hypothetical protein D9M69_731330 [compost metagenome]